MITIDVVIPSYRLKKEFLLNIIGMKVPEHVTVQYIIVADNPAIELPQELLALAEKGTINILRNKQNTGAALSRNRGIEYGAAGWILFLDDDVRPVAGLLQAYTLAIESRPAEIGFFGETIFPNPVNSFTHGLVAGDMLYAFSYARFNDETRCATTSNVMIKRSAMGDIRFKDGFPKKGGGEDYAFFLEFYERNRQTLKSVKGASVYHNWWYNGKRNYHQYVRWAIADYKLFKMFPQITYYDFPNIAEMLFIGIIVGMPVFILSNLSCQFILCILAGIILGEVLTETIRLFKTKGSYGVRYMHEVFLVKSIADISRLYSYIRHADFKYFLRRPNYSSFDVSIEFRYWSFRKFVAYLLTSILLMIFLL